MSNNFLHICCILFSLDISFLSRCEELLFFSLLTLSFFLCVPDTREHLIKWLDYKAGERSLLSSSLLLTRENVDIVVFARGRNEWRRRCLCERNNCIFSHAKSVERVWRQYRRMAGRRRQSMLAAEQQKEQQNLTTFVAAAKSACARTDPTLQYRYDILFLLPPSRGRTDKKTYI